MGILQFRHRYRASGATAPWSDPGRSHQMGPGSMEGYFWRITDRDSGRVLIALIGVNQAGSGPWATLGLAAHPGRFCRVAEPDGAWAATDRLAAGAGSMFTGDDARLRVDLGADARLEVRLEDLLRWPARAFGGSSIFGMVPALNQYWHPWLLGGRASGTAVVGEERWEFTAAQVYAEKNWGRGGFPDSWWWGQAQGFDAADACVAFAGGQVRLGALRTTVTALVVRLPGGRVVRLGNPITSPVRAEIGADDWRLQGRGGGWRIDVHGHAPLADAHVLPVPLPLERRNFDGAREHLAGTLKVRVQRHGRLLWEGISTLAGLEHGRPPDQVAAGVFESFGEGG